MASFAATPAAPPARAVACAPRAHARAPAPASPPLAPPPRRLYDCAFLISVLELHMQLTIRRNEHHERLALLRHRRGVAAEPSVFHALQPPSITPVEYLKRLARYSFCSRSVFVAAFFYLDRIAAMGDVDLHINSLSVHRLLLTAVLLATKVIDDVLYDNAHFAKVGGLDVKELNMLELDMLKVLDFRLHINPEDFEAFELRLLDTALTSRDPDYAILPGRLRNLGYDVDLQKPTPSSPASCMDVVFSSE